MNKTEYEEYIKQARKTYQRQEEITVDEVKNSLKRATKVCSELIEKAEDLRKDYYSYILAEINTIIDNLDEELKNAIYTGTRQSIHISSDVAGKILEEVAEDIFDKVEIARFVADLDERSLMSYLSKTYKGNLKISDRIWNISEEARRQITETIESGITLGRNPRAVAEDLKRFLNPDVARPLREETRKRLGFKEDIPMQAARLAVTEMNNAFYEGNINSYNALPFYEGVYWKLSNAHVVTDICDDYAHHNRDGFFLKGEEPVKPHPWCRCYVVPVFQDKVKTIEDLRDWARNPLSNPELENWYKLNNKTLSRPVEIKEEKKKWRTNERGFPIGDTTAEAEQIARELDLADNISYYNMPAEIANMINEAVADVLKDFPESRAQFKLVGSHEVVEWCRFIEGQCRNELGTAAIEIRELSEKLRAKGLSAREKQTLEKAIDGWKKKAKELQTLLTDRDLQIKEFEAKGNIYKKYRKRYEEVVAIEEKEMGPAVAYTGQGKMVGLMPKYYGKSSEKLFQYQSEIHNWVPHGGKKESVPYHEAGHQIFDFIKDRGDVSEITTLYRDVKGSFTEKDRARMLSEYGFSTVDEMVAESVAEVKMAQREREKPQDFAKRVYGMLQDIYAKYGR